MVEQFLGGELGSAGGNAELEALVERLRVDVAADLDRFDITTAVDRIWELVRWLNRHVTERKPWELAKDDARREELQGVLHDLADGLRVVAIALAAYLPETAGKILAALGQRPELDWTRVVYGQLEHATGIRGAQPLFPRTEAPAAA